MYQRRSSFGLGMSSTPSAARPSAAYLDSAPLSGDPEDGYNYTDYIPQGARDALANCASPPPTAFHMGAYHDRRSSSGGDIIRHPASHGGGSYELLLANYRQPTPPNARSPQDIVSEFPPRSRPVRCRGMCKSPMKWTKNLRASFAVPSFASPRVQSSSSLVTFLMASNTLPPRFPGHPLGRVVVQGTDVVQCGGPAHLEAEFIGPGGCWGEAA